MTMKIYQLREATTEDFNFIANSYLKSYRTAPETRPMINEVYFPEYKSRLEHMIKTGLVVVAHAQDDVNHIFGYVIASAVGNYPVLHYVYVKFPFRRIGIAKDLVTAILPGLGEQVTVVTHQPRNWEAASKKYKLIYDPKYARETK